MNGPASEKDLYIMQADNGLIKIGRSSNLSLRISEFERMFNINIVCINLIEKAGLYESFLIKKYKKYVVKEYGREWFSFPIDIIINLKLLNYSDLESTYDLDDLCDSEQSSPNFTAKIPEELKMWLKLHCVENEISMTGLIIDLIEHYKLTKS